MKLINSCALANCRRVDKIILDLSMCMILLETRIRDN